MTDTLLSQDFAINIFMAMGLTGMGTLFTLISLGGTIRGFSRPRLHYTLFTLSITLYCLLTWLSLAALVQDMGNLVEIAAEILFFLIILSYSYLYHVSLKGFNHRKTAIMLVVISFTLLAFTLLSLFLKSDLPILSWISKNDWGLTTIAVAGLFIFIRLVMSFCYHESGKVGAIVSLLLFLLPLLSLMMEIEIRILEWGPRAIFSLISLPLLIIWEFARLYTASTHEKKSHNLPVGILREQLTQSSSEKSDISNLLVKREEELGQYILKARKVSRRLLPSVIHHDGKWEVTTYANPKKRAQERDFFDFYYTYGRKVAGVSFFSTPIDLEGALFTSVLKKEWTEGFNEAKSLASLYRRTNAHLWEIFSKKDLSGGAIKFDVDKIEYTGFNNPHIYYLNGKIKKCAPLIQDKAATVDDIKSYTMPCEDGDSFLICNKEFLSKPAPITGKSFEKEKLTQVLESFTGNSADLVQELIDERNRFMGKKDDQGILLIHIKRKA